MISGLIAAFENDNSDHDSIDSSSNIGDISSLGLQSLVSNTFDLGDCEAEKDNECTGTAVTSVA